MRLFSAPDMGFSEPCKVNLLDSFIYRMSVRIRHDDKGRQGECVLTWSNYGLPSITRDMVMSQLPDFIIFHLERTSSLENV